MPDHAFCFALDLSDQAHFNQMVRDLAAVVLRHVGYDAGTIAEVTRDVQDALAAGTADGSDRCVVRFCAGGGALEIRIAFAGGRTWEAARALPSGS